MKTHHCLNQEGSNGNLRSIIQSKQHRFQFPPFLSDSLPKETDYGSPLPTIHQNSPPSRLMSSTIKSDPPPPAASSLTELKLFQTFIFSLPIFFAFILLFLFYWFYLRRRRVDWASIEIPTIPHGDDGITRSELGLKKEIREMLPIIVYKESFCVNETQLGCCNVLLNLLERVARNPDHNPMCSICTSKCSVCLGDYEAEEKLQQIPPCGHTFHMDCIDHWLATHTTCPLCRLSLLSPPKHEANSESAEVSSEHRQEVAVEEEEAVGDEVKEVDFQLVGGEAEVTSSM